MASSTKLPAGVREHRYPTGLVIWDLPGSILGIGWNRGGRLLIGDWYRAGGAVTTIDHPTARDTYATLQEARAAVDRFVSLVE